MTQTKINFQHQITLQALFDWKMHWLILDLEELHRGSAWDRSLPVAELSERRRVGLKQTAGSLTKFLMELDTMFDYPQELNDEIRVHPKTLQFKELVGRIQRKIITDLAEDAAQKAMTSLGVYADRIGEPRLVLQTLDPASSAVDEPIPERAQR